MKLCDIRRVIARDRLPQVPPSFQFRMDEMAVITEAQEGTWDADVFTDDSGNSVCIIVPQKSNKGGSVSSTQFSTIVCCWADRVLSHCFVCVLGVSVSSTVNGRGVGHAATNSSLSAQKPHPKESTHRVMMQQNQMQHQGLCVCVCHDSIEMYGLVRMECSRTKKWLPKLAAVCSVLTCWCYVSGSCWLFEFLCKFDA